MSIIKKYIILFVLIGTVAVYPQITVTLPNSSGLVGTEILAPVKVSDLSGLNVSSLQLQINYDNTVISILGVSTSGTIMNGESPGLNNIDSGDPGFRKIAWASGTKTLTGSGVLLNLRIKFLVEGSSTLTLDETYSQFAKYESGTSTTYTVNAVNGSATGSFENLAPVFDSVSDQTVKEGKTLSFTVHATDPEGQSLTYTNGELPDGATFNTSTQEFSWTPSLGQAGSYSVLFLANDGKNIGQLTVNIEVTESNTAPKINAIPDTTISEGETVSFYIEATDDENDPLHYSTSTLPSGALFDTTTQYFFWTPNYNQQGNYNITFTVSDGKLSSDITVKITVQNVNQAPFFTKTLAADTISAYEPAVEFTFQYEASDPDNDPLTFSLEGSYPLGCSITSNGLLKWAPTASQVGLVYTLTIKVSDGSLSKTTTTTIVVDQLVSARDPNTLPTATELYQNYPNPFNPTTTIEYSLKNDSHVSISVFNILGQEVVTLVNSFKRAGFHSVDFKGTNLESGIYIYRITAGNFVDVKRMMLLK